MDGRNLWRWQSYLRGILLVALLAIGLAACGRPMASISGASLFSTDALYIEVMQHISSPYQDSSIFSRTIRDEATIAQVRQDITSVNITSPNALFSCPIGLPQHFIYTLEFYQAARLVEVVTINATNCEFINVKDAGTGATVERCCPGSDFWARLQQATGAPPPA